MSAWKQGSRCSAALAQELLNAAALPRRWWAVDSHPVKLSTHLRQKLLESLAWQELRRCGEIGPIGITRRFGTSVSHNHRLDIMIEHPVVTPSPSSS